MDSFLSKLKQKLSEALPGKLAQVQMAPEIRIESLLNENGDIQGAKKAAILIPLYYKDSELYTALIKRVVYDGVHSGQIAFPGGRWEVSDKTLVDTALREAEEEVNIKHNTVEVLGTLSQLYVPPSNFTILPVIGSSSEIPHFIPQAGEVQDILEVKLSELTNPRNKGVTHIITKYAGEFSAPCYFANREIIWGATAMVISELNQVIAQME